MLLPSLPPCSKIAKFFGRKSKSTEAKAVKIAEEPVAEVEPSAPPAEEVEERDSPVVEDNDGNTSAGVVADGDETAVSVGEEATEEAAEEAAEEKEDDTESEPAEADVFGYKRISTMLAQLRIPLSAKSGEMLSIDHDGEKQIKVPAGQQGQEIQVKMVNGVKEEEQVEEPTTGMICCM